MQRARETFPLRPSRAPHPTMQSDIYKRNRHTHLALLITFMYKTWPDQEGLVNGPDSYRENAKPDLQSLSAVANAK